MINNGITSQVTTKLDEIKEGFNSLILDVINTAIAEKVSEQKREGLSLEYDIKQVSGNTSQSACVLFYKIVKRNSQVYQDQPDKKKQTQNRKFALLFVNETLFSVI